MKSEDEIRSIIIDRGKDFISDFYKNNLSWYSYKSKVENVSKLLPANSVVLDAGCGYGYSTAYMAFLRPDIRIVGYDVCPHSTWKYLTDNRVKFYVIKSGKPNFKKCTFDAVVSFGVMEHVENDEDFLKTMHNLLKKGGKNIIAHLPNKYSMNEFLSGVLSKDHHEKRYDKANVKWLLQSTGFRLISIERDYIIPMQLYKLSGKIGKVIENAYKKYIAVDRFLLKTPMRFVSESFTIISEKM